MAAPAYPTVMLEPIAADAGGGYITNPIPDAPTGTNAASVQQGFPPITMTSELSGGEPPLGQDMNGFLNLLSQHLVYLQAGAGYTYDADVSSAIGGYGVGAVVEMADGSGYWYNTQAANTYDPDEIGAAGVGWVPLYSYGVATVTGLTGGTYALNVQQWRRNIIVLSGTLAGNLTIQFPNVEQEWLIINNTTGAFTTTAVNISAGGGGASVTIPQGGPGSPIGIYGMADGNMYPTVAPLGIPIDQGPTPSTIVERTNLGAVLAAYFYSSVAADNGTITAVWYEENNSGNMNKMSLANFQTQLGVALALSGASTAATQAVGNATSLIATTAFVNPGSVLTGSGPWYRRNPDGSITQWGKVSTTANAGALAINFGIAFPNANQGVKYSVIAPSGVGGAGSYENYITAESRNGFSMTLVASSNAGIVINWEANGY